MRVKVWNDNKYDYTESFRGKDYKIPAGQFVEMEFDEAHAFQCSFSKIIRDADGNHDPRGFKMIRLEMPTAAAATTAKAPDHLCQKCRYLGTDAKDLAQHMVEHAEDVVVDEEAEAEIAAKRRGRPPKAAAQAS